MDYRIALGPFHLFTTAGQGGCTLPYVLRGQAAQERSGHHVAKGQRVRGLRIETSVVHLGHNSRGLEVGIGHPGYHFPHPFDL